jgi:hypothetical protein
VWVARYRESGHYRDVPMITLDKHGSRRHASSASRLQQPPVARKVCHDLN